MASLYHKALAELGAVFERIDQHGVDKAVDAIAGARRIALYGCGREGLQLKGFCMRMFHLGLEVAMVGDMTTFAVGPGDLFIASAGPGALPTAEALLRVARGAGATTMLVTAEPHGQAAKLADVILTIPAQTMASDTGPGLSVLPMGSLFEGAQYVLFEIMILTLRDRLAVTPEAMRANHTNLE
jgi:6-phospho-3-hexuloisomerase